MTKKIYLLLLILFFFPFTNIFAVFSDNKEAINFGEKSFEIIGFSKDEKAFAFRIASYCSSKCNYSCNYPKLNNKTIQSVELYLFDNQKITGHWTIYSDSPCTNHKDATIQLDNAKSAYKAANVSLKIKPILPIRKNDKDIIPQVVLGKYGINAPVSIFTRHSDGRGKIIASSENYGEIALDEWEDISFIHSAIQTHIKGIGPKKDLVILILSGGDGTSQGPYFLSMKHIASRLSIR